MTRRTRPLLLLMILLLGATAMIILMDGVFYAVGALFPKQDKPFEVTGEISGRSYWQTGFNLIPGMFDSMLIPSETHEGFCVNVGNPNIAQCDYHALGRWNGPFPSIGTKVRITSPTGQVKDVRIYDLTTSQVYQSQ